jgi:hypothetical protein
VTTGDPEVLGTDDRRPPDVRLRALLVVALLVAGTAVAVQRQGRQSVRTPPRPAVAPTPTITVVPEPAVAALAGPRVARVGAAAALLGHTDHTPSYGTVTMLDGPPGASPLTFSMNVRLPVAAVGAGAIGWFAEQVVDDDAQNGPGALEERDVRTGALLGDRRLEGVAHSIALAGGDVWVGLDDAVVEVDARTGMTHRRPTPSGEVVDLVSDPSGRYLYAAIADGDASRILRWTAPGLTAVREHPLEPGLRVTHLSYGPDGLWVSAVSSRAGTGRVERLDPATLHRLDDGGLAASTSVTAAYAGTHELWLLGLHDGTLRCARVRGRDVRLGRPTHVPDFAPREDPSGLVAAVGHRVYVVSGRGVIAYERTVECG